MNAQYTSLQEMSFGDNQKKVTKLFQGKASVDLFNSKELNLELMDLISKSPLLNPYTDILVKLIKNKVIYPVRYNKSYMQFLAKKVKVFFLKNLNVWSNKDVSASTIGGFYDSKVNKIYLLIDNNSNIFNNVIEKQISQLLLHELAHYCATNYKKAFYDMTKSTMVSFYKYFFQSMFKMKNHDDLCKLLSGALFSKIELSKINVSVKTWDNIIDYVQKYKNLSSYPNDKFDFIYINFLFMLIPVLLEHGFISNMEFQKRYRLFHMACLMSYIKMRINKSDIERTMFYQEFVFPSEIIAISSCKPQLSSKYMKLIK